MGVWVGAVNAVRESSDRDCVKVFEGIIRKNQAGITMNEQLFLENIRDVLARLEESIIFGFIERAQFDVNPVVYEPGAFSDPVGEHSLTGYLLHETEKIHARVRRYTSPDEHAFFEDLPEPVLKPLQYYENPLVPNTINMNNQVRRVYETEIVPRICEAGDDAQYGSSAVCDVNNLQTLSRRIHYGKFVAESKYQNFPDKYEALIRAGNGDAIRELISDEAVEDRLLKRVEAKARAYGQELTGEATVENSPSARFKISPEVIVELYRDWIIPLTKDVEVQYLLACH